VKESESMYTKKESESMYTKRAFGIRLLGEKNTLATQQQHISNTLSAFGDLDCLGEREREHVHNKVGEFAEKLVSRAACHTVSEFSFLLYPSYILHVMCITPYECVHNPVMSIVHVHILLVHVHIKGGFRERHLWHFEALEIASKVYLLYPYLL
jgi:hypothetical protein